MKTLKFLLSLLIVLNFTSCGNESDSKKFSNDTESTKKVEENYNPIPPEKSNTPPNKLSYRNKSTFKDEGSEINSPGINNKTIQESEIKTTSSTEQTEIKTDRMIIRTGTINIEVEEYNKSEEELFSIVNNLNGYISNSASNVNTSGRKQGKIDIRIKAKDFETLISKISKSGKVISLNINSSDITNEFIDLEARKTTQKALEERLLNLLNIKTAKLTDVVEVEQKLAEVRSQIESMQGRMRFLKNQSEYSTLTVSLFEPYIIQSASGSGFFFELGEAFKKGLEGFTDVLAGIITFAVASSPFIFMVLLILYVLRKFYLKWKIRRDAVKIQTS